MGAARVNLKPSSYYMWDTNKQNAPCSLSDLRLTITFDISVTALAFIHTRQK